MASHVSTCFVGSTILMTMDVDKTEIATGMKSAAGANEDAPNDNDCGFWLQGSAWVHAALNVKTMMIARTVWTVRTCSTFWMMVQDRPCVRDEDCPGGLCRNGQCVAAPLGNNA